MLKLSSSTDGCAGGQRLVQLLQRLDFDLDRQSGCGGQRPAHRRPDAPGEPLVVVLDQDGGVEPGAMVGAAAAAHRVLLEDAQRRRGLAGIEDGDAARGGVHEARGQGRDAREPLQEVQRDPLGREQGPGPSGHFGHRLAGFAAGPVAPAHGEDRVGVELPEGRFGDPDAGDHQRRLGDDDAARLHRRVHRGRAGDVAAADVLGEGAGDQVAHELGRRPDRCAHAAPPGAGGGANATDTAKASAGV